ncbi:ABC transporter permease [Umezawaea tangerina]|uniref:ABC-2 type transport system permease protein n=1 Tax=Umezawaea tangerina TaxID=84725 RepID=A0A2T0T810_9PSEU|nr:ABC transporter permease [Umezawaea tangerina]PRY41793.1 ABC-2 type transport system permease protein [Umezawaea tangerina]
MRYLVRTSTVLRYSAANAWADFRASYTWWSWTFGWLGRMLAQVTFFAFVGIMLGDQAQLRYLVVGNAVMTCVVETMSVVASSSSEGRIGTLPLLSAAPVRLAWVFLGRSVQWPVSGSLTALVSLLALAPAFGVHWSPTQVPALVLLVPLTALSTYAVGLFLSAFVLTASGARNLLSNSAYLVMMAICGVQVPVDFWPSWVRSIASTLPLTHGLAAIRSVGDRAPVADVLGQAGLALACGVGWLVMAVLAFSLLEQHSRRRDAFDFGG